MFRNLISKTFSSESLVTRRNSMSFMLGSGPSNQSILTSADSLDNASLASMFSYVKQQCSQRYNILYSVLYWRV